jgi:hypothetical protein
MIVSNEPGIISIDEKIIAWEEKLFYSFRVDKKNTFDRILKQ